MSIIIKEVSDKKSLEDFVKLPYRLYKENNYWIPPIISDERVITSYSIHYTKLYEKIQKTRH